MGTMVTRAGSKDFKVPFISDLQNVDYAHNFEFPQLKSLMSFQIWRILHSRDSAGFESGVSKYELLCSRELLANGELY